MSETKPRLILVGGFLGAGKTTLLLRAARMLTERGHRVGLITNDQGDDLVDTALANRERVPVVEVAGGCFCCRFPDLIGALHHLRDTVNPDVFLAEPVGSCTDLMATVLRPLAHYHADEYHVAPLTVLLDGPAHTAHRRAPAYSADVRYLQHQQLDEAELLLLNKTDQWRATDRAEEVRRLQQQVAPVPVLPVSAHTGEGVAAWLDRVMRGASDLERVLSIDYDRYAQAEAQLGWLNARGTLRADLPFSARNWLTHLLGMTDTALRSQGAAIAHVKAQVTTPAEALKASLTRSGGPITWDAGEANGDGNSTHEGNVTDRAEFILNARVAAAPGELERTVRTVFAEVTPDDHFRYDFSHFECFSPLPPQPTHRELG